MKKRLIIIAIGLSTLCCVVVLQNVMMARRNEVKRRYLGVRQTLHIVGSGVLHYALVHGKPPTRVDDINVSDRDGCAKLGVADARGGDYEISDDGLGEIVISKTAYSPEKGEVELSCVVSLSSNKVSQIRERVLQR